MSPAASSTAASSTAASSTAGVDAPFEPLDPAVAAAARDLAHSRDPHQLIPGDPAGLRAAARSLVDNADLHDALAVRQRHLHDAGWSGAAADAFHTHLTRQATRHDGVATATRTAATALTELADGIDTARTHAGRAAQLDADGDPDHRTDRRTDPALREEAHDLLADTRARLADLHTRVRTRLATAQQALPDTHRLLTDPDPSSRIASPETPTLPALAEPPALPILDTPATPSTAGAVAVADAAAAPAIPPAAAMPLWAAADTEIPTSGPRQPEGPPGTAPAGTLATTHRPRRQIDVRPGDTLSGIAARELGDPTRWPEILDCNPALAHPWQIRPGQRLLLPDGPDPAADDPHRSVPDPPDSAQPPPTAAPTTHPGGAAGPSQPAPSTGLDTAPNDGNSDAGGVSLEEGLLIGGGLAAALSVAYLLHQRRRDRGFRPGTPDIDDATDATDNTDLDGDRLYRSGGGERIASFGHDAGTGPARGRSDGARDANDVAASIRAALDPPTPSSRRTATADDPPTVPARRIGEPAMPPVVRRLHYAYHRTPQAGRPVRPAASAVAGWAGPLLAPQPRQTPGHGHGVQAGSAPLVVPLGISTTGAGVYADLTLAPAVALTNLTGPNPLEHSGDRAEDAARALLLTIAAGLRTPTGDPLGHVVITSADLRRLLGLTDPLPSTVTLPATIRVVDDLDAALDDLEVTLAHRPPGPHSLPPPAAVLIATAPRPGTPTARMQRLLDNGHPQRVCAILLGDWPTPTRIALAPDATAAAITGPLPPQLAGARLFTVPRHDALDLLAALARPTDPDHTLTPTPTHDPTYQDASDERPDPQHPEVNVNVGVDVGVGGRRSQRDDDPDTAPTPGATQEPASTSTTSCGPRWLLQVLGRVSLHAESEQSDPAETAGGTVSGGAGPKPVTGRGLELLVYLALHPGGVSHERLVADLWPDTAPTAAGADLDMILTDVDAALTQPARGLSDPAAHLIGVDEHGHRQLNPRLIAVDYHHFTAALAARRAATTAAQRATADRALLDHYRGPLAPDLHADWIDAPRRHATRAAITAALDLARHFEDGEDPDQAVAILQHSIAAIDPYNEALYARLIRLHRDHGRPDAALRTFAALVTQLATIETTPSPDITTLIGIS